MTINYLKKKWDYINLKYIPDHQVPCHVIDSEYGILYGHRIRKEKLNKNNVPLFQCNDGVYREKHKIAQNLKKNRGFEKWI
jgi:hypothetical protein